MTISGRLNNDFGKGSLGGRAYTFDLALDVLHISVSNDIAEFADYVELPDKGEYKDLYMIVDFDRNGRVVGLTIEGLLEDYRRTSLFARFAVDLGYLGLQHMSKKTIDKILDYIKDQMPALDTLGQGPGRAFA